MLDGKNNKEKTSENYTQIKWTEAGKQKENNDH